jgi:serine/threonine protein kinase
MCVSLQALDLLQRMLKFNPNHRISVEEALAHPYLASLHDISDEPCCPTPWTWDLDSEAITQELVGFTATPARVSKTGSCLLSTLTTLLIESCMK